MAPVDPADAFRGRYLALGFTAEGTAVPAGSRLEHGEWAFASLAEDDRGLARLEAAAGSPPAEGDYLRLRVDSTDLGPQGREVWVDLPFDRLYLPEGLAPAAEARLLAGTAGTADPDAPPRAWAVIRVRDGRGVLEDLVIDGISARGR